jgi:hypothetical protein
MAIRELTRFSSSDAAALACAQHPLIGFGRDYPPAELDEAGMICARIVAPPDQTRTPPDQMEKKVKQGQPLPPPAVSVPNTIYRRATVFRNRKGI